MKKVISSAVAAATIITIAATPAHAKKRVQPSAPTYTQGAEISASGFARLQTLDVDCRKQLKAQRPSMLKNVLLTAVRNAPGAALGTALGASLGGFTPKGGAVSATDYAKYGGVATIGGSIGAGINGYEVGKHTAQAGCMSNFVGMNRKERRELSRVAIVYNSFSVNGKAVRGPDGKKVGKGDYFVLFYHPEAIGDDSSAIDSGDRSADDVPTSPPSN